MVCMPSGTTLGSWRTVEVKLSPEAVGQVARAGARDIGAPLFFGERCVDLAKMVRHAGAGTGLEAGQLLEQDVELNRAADLWDGFDSGAPSWIGGAAEKLQHGPRIGIAHDQGRAQSLAGLELHSLPRNDPGDGCAGHDDRARVARDVAENE